MLVGLLVAVAITLSEASIQKVSINGSTICGDRYISGVTVQLWEEDTFDPDDLLEEGITAKTNGTFSVSGVTEETTLIEPYALFIHNCDVKNAEKCVRSTRFPIDRKYINGPVYEMSLVQLKTRQGEDKETCREKK
ncbi:unnamed protein product, partial [Mesorhabditis belari]|uniref:Transthyretin-like family protein n=1 Tax=Mesorhabditis belari TaxID=2138241 RepID=A0AAF3JAC6_9BILA